MKLMEYAHTFITTELLSDAITSKLRDWGKECPWILNNQNIYFQLSIDIPDEGSLNMPHCVCSKIYAQELVFVSIYFEGSFYVVLEDGSGDQPILDVRFPDVTKNCEGITLAMYEDCNREIKKQIKHDSIIKWNKLSVWKSVIVSENDQSANISIQCVEETSLSNERGPLFYDLSSTSYVHTYCVLKNDFVPKLKEKDNENKGAFRHVFFRFGNWCYSGEVDLIPDIELADLPFVIPAIRSQQNQLPFISDISELSIENPYTTALTYFEKVVAVMNQEVSQSENPLNSLMSQLDRMGLGGSAKFWLEGDSKDIIFEFLITRDDPETIKSLKNIDMMATKRYDPNGFVTICAYFCGSFYLSIMEADGEQPLLDSRFPNIAEKGRGYQLKSYPNGVKECSGLRKMCVWQTISGMEKELELKKRNADQRSSRETENIIKSKTAKQTVKNHEQKNDSIQTRPQTEKEKQKATGTNIKDKILINKKKELRDNHRESEKNHEGTNKIKVKNEIGQKTSPALTTSKKAISDESRTKDEKINNERTEKISQKRMEEKIISTKKRNIIARSSIQSNSCSMKKLTSKTKKSRPNPNLGAFHHLAPLKISSKLEKKMKKTVQVENLSSLGR